MIYPDELPQLSTNLAPQRMLGKLGSGLSSSLVKGDQGESLGDAWADVVDAFYEKRENFRFIDLLQLELYMRFFMQFLSSKSSNQK